MGSNLTSWSSLSLTRLTPSRNHSHTKPWVRKPYHPLTLSLLALSPSHPLTWTSGTWSQRSPRGGGGGGPAAASPWAAVSAATWTGARDLSIRLVASSWASWCPSWAAALAACWREGGGGTRLMRTLGSFFFKWTQVQRCQRWENFGRSF